MHPLAEAIASREEAVAKENAGLRAKNVLEDDKVASRFTATGTFTNEFQGLPPSGERIEFSGMNVMRIVDGKSLEEWDDFDTMALMGQLGAIHTHH